MRKRLPLQAPGKNLSRVGAMFVSTTSRKRGFGKTQLASLEALVPTAITYRTCSPVTVRLVPNAAKQQLLFTCLLTYCAYLLCCYSTCVFQSCCGKAARWDLCCSGNYANGFECRTIRLHNNEPCVVGGKQKVILIIKCGVGGICIAPRFIGVSSSLSSTGVLLSTPFGNTALQFCRRTFTTIPVSKPMSGIQTHTVDADHRTIPPHLLDDKVCASRFNVP